MGQFATTTRLLQSNEPLVVGAVSDAATLLRLADGSVSSEGCDVLELRLDLIELPTEELKNHAQKLARPLLITARHPDEGGRGNLTVAQRVSLLEALLPQATLMDIELRSAPEMLTLIRKAQNQRVAVIGSFHDFTSTPNEDVLRGSVDFGLQLKLDAVKLATQLQNADDLARLLHVLIAEKRLPMSVMGMGSLGRVSRLLLARCGSILNYGYLGSANASGQWPAQKLKELLKEL